MEMSGGTGGDGGHCCPMEFVIMARGVLHIPVKLYASRQSESVELSRINYGYLFY